MCYSNLAIQLSLITRNRRILAGLLLLVLFLHSGRLFNAAEAEQSEISKPVVEQLVPVDPPGLRNDRALAENLGNSEAKWLKSGDTEFLGIFNDDTSGNALGSVLILPAPGNSPLAAGALPELATGLSANGWRSLAITLPELDFSGPAPIFPDAKSIVASSEATVDEKAANSAEEPPQKEPVQNKDVPVELPDAKKWFAEQQTKNMEKLLARLLAAEPQLLANGGKYVLIAQGASAELVMELISSKVINPSGFISLSIQHPVYQRASSIPTHLAAINIPVLDIYTIAGQKQAEKRKIKQKGNNYRQLLIPGNDINFRGSEDVLLKRIKGWLKKHYSSSN